MTPGVWASYFTMPLFVGIGILGGLGGNLFECIRWNSERTLPRNDIELLINYCNPYFVLLDVR